MRTSARHRPIYWRPDSDEKKLFNPNDAVKNTLKLVWNELKYKAEIVEEYIMLWEWACLPQMWAHLTLRCHVIVLL